MHGCTGEFYKGMKGSAFMFSRILTIKPFHHMFDRNTFLAGNYFFDFGACGIAMRTKALWGRWIGVWVMRRPSV
jgi:hypothetical protein